MEHYKVEGKNGVPSINCDSETGLITIEGRSIPENPTKFFLPLLEWMKNYSHNPASVTHMIIKLDYFNTSSSKFLFDLMYSMESMHIGGKTKCKISWYYEAGDNKVLEAGQDYGSMLTLPFETIEY